MPRTALTFLNSRARSRASIPCPLPMWEEAISRSLRGDSLPLRLPHRVGQRFHEAADLRPYLVVGAPLLVEVLPRERYEHVLVKHFRPREPERVTDLRLGVGSAAPAAGAHDRHGLAGERGAE